MLEASTQKRLSRWLDAAPTASQDPQMTYPADGVVRDLPMPTSLSTFQPINPNLRHADLVVGEKQNGSTPLM